MVFSFQLYIQTDISKNLGKRELALCWKTLINQGLTDETCEDSSLLAPVYSQGN